MTVQFVNDLTGRTLTAGYTAGGTTLTISSAFISSAQTGDIYMRVDNEIFKCTAGANSTSLTVTGGIDGTTAADHAVGATVRIVASAAHMQAFDADLAHLAGTETLTGAKTFSSATATDFSGAPIKVVAGSASAPGVTFGTDPDTGIYRVGANSLGISAGGVKQAQINTVAVSLENNLAVAKNLAVGVQKIGAAYTLVGTTPAELQIDTANATLLLNQTIWGYTTTPQYIITDPNGLLGAGTPLVITPWDDVVSEFNDINGGQAATGVWNGLGGPNGPGGVTMALATQYGKYSLTRNMVDTGSGATGGWTLVLLGVLL